MGVSATTRQVSKQEPSEQHKKQQVSAGPYAALNTLLKDAIKKCDELSAVEKPAEKNINARLVAFYAILNETLSKCKQVLDEKKRDHRKEIDETHQHRRKMAIGQCMTNVTLGTIAAVISPLGEASRTISECMNKMSGGADAIWGDKNQRDTHTVTTVDKKIDSGSGIKQNMSRNEEAILRSLSEAIRNRTQVFVNKNVAGG